MEFSKALLLDMLEKMVLIRRFEEKVYQLATRGVVHGSVHLCIGEEAASVGSTMPLEKKDYILPTHRGHGQGLQKGADPNRLLAEIVGRKEGLCKGRVGSMHFFDKDNNNLGAQGILGAQFPIAVGVGLAIKLKKMDSILACYFGDGTSNQGTFFEALNFADMWDLPIIFVCINNLYGMGTHYEDTCNIKVHQKAKLYNMEVKTADGTDVKDVYKKMSGLVKKVRKERRPAMIECYTYRFLGHSAFDNRPYRPKEEVKEWKSKDPIKRLEAELVQQGIKEEEIEKIKDKIEEIIKGSEEFALGADFPIFDPSMET